MYAVKVVLQSRHRPDATGGPGPPVVMPTDQRLDAVAQCARAAPRPGIAHVTLTRWGWGLVGMTFVEAASLDEALARARDGWEWWLSLPGLLPDWVLGDCRPDRYLNAGPLPVPPDGRVA